MSPTPKQLEALKEMIHIGSGRGAGVLNTILQSPISLQASEIRMMTQPELSGLPGLAEQRLCLVLMPFKGPLEGISALILPTREADRLVGCLTDRELGSTTMDTLEAGTLCEIGNIVLNGVMGTISNILGLSLIYQVPCFRQGDINLIRATPGQGNCQTIVAHARFEMEGIHSAGYFALFFAAGSLEALLERVDALILEEA